MNRMASLPFYTFISCFINKKKICEFLSIFIVLLLTSLMPVSADIVISEFMASNGTVLVDQDGDAEDWIELHNTGTNSVDLQDWSLSDDDGDLTAWKFPSVTIGADEYLVIFASDKDRAQADSELHTNFKLKAGGEYLALTMPDGVTVAFEYAEEYPKQFEDISYGGSTYFPFPTPGAQNNVGLSSLEAELEFDLAHGFFELPQALTLTSNLPDGTIRYTLDGSVPPEGFGCEAQGDPSKPWFYEYFEGIWAGLPDFSALTAVKSGVTDQVSTDIRQRDNNFAIRFVGCIIAPSTGTYKFTTTSKGESQLLIDGDLLVNNLSAGSAASSSNEIMLEKGLHEVVITYSQTGGDHGIVAEWIAPMRGKTFVATPDEGDIHPADAESEDFVEFEFELPSDGVFRFSALVEAPSAESDSFWVQLDDGPLWLYRISSLEAFSEVDLNNDNVAITPSLEAGEHTLKFFVHEDGAKIDSLKIAAIECDGPCQTQVIEAEIENISGSFILGGLSAEAIPAKSWFTYTGPITIDQTSAVRAVALQENFLASDVETQSYFFLDDVLEQSRNEESPQEWPEGNINGQDMDYGMDPDIVNLDPQAVKTSILSLPSISIVTDIDNLLHSEAGIYVNASERGRAWERPASIELIDPQKIESGFTIDAGIRIRGGFSRIDDNPKHPFRLYFRSSYDGDLNYPLFGEEGVDSFERVDLWSPNSRSWSFKGSNKNTFLRDIWLRDTQAALGQPYTRSRYYHLFINGQYWGVNMTQERVSKHYAKSYFGGNESDYDIVKHGDSLRYEAKDGYNDEWNQIWDTVADQVISSSEYDFLKQKVDLDNLIDYMLVNAYSGNPDGATSDSVGWLRANNWYALHDRGGAQLKWSFFQHDAEQALGAFTKDKFALGPHAPFNGQPNQYFNISYMNPYWLHAALTSKTEYRQRFKDRAAELFAGDGALSKENALSRWLKRKAEVQPAILAHSARWGDSKAPANPLTVYDWEAEVNRVENDFFSDRSRVVVNRLFDVDLVHQATKTSVGGAGGASFGSYLNGLFLMLVLWLNRRKIRLYFSSAVE